MQRPKIYLIIFLLLGSSFSKSTWGFYGHRLINRMSIFLLPEPLFGFYKIHLDYIQNHAIDPDKRRYSIKAEGPRHYIDLDHWSPKQVEEMKSLSLKEVILANADYIVAENGEERLWEPSIDSSLSIQIYAELDTTWVEILSATKLTFIQLPQYDKLTVVDRFSEHGILPYHLLFYATRLERAFFNGDLELILKYSSEIGHYIADAHVPLHTTSNYNGQFTGQTGIHAFWETRIPELFAESEYDFFLDKAKYIDEWQPFFWDIVIDTHQLVDEVLQAEKDIRKSIPEDLQYCYEERNGQIKRLECSEYAKMYAQRMNGMVEQQMQKATNAIASVWYTAWANAGMPDLPIEQINELYELPLEENHQLRNK